MLRLLFVCYLFLYLVFLNPYSLLYINSGFQFPVFNISLFSFYPILFFPVFLEETKEERIVFIQFFFGCGLALFSLWYFSFNFFWLSSVLIGLSFCSYFKYRFHSLGFFLFLLTPPFVEKYTLFIGFELRLLLSRVTGVILKFFDSNILVQGNLIIYKNQAFSIDPSCEGLRFFTGTFLLLLIFQYTFLKENLNIRRLRISLCLSLLSIILWLWANLVRILILILLTIPEESSLHPIFGIISFLCFIGIPFSLFFVYFIYEKPNLKSRLESILFKKDKYNYSLILLFLLPIFLSAIILFRAKNYTNPTYYWKNAYGDFSRDQDMNNLESQFYRNKKATLIIKKNLPFLGLGHHPKICFEAIGYSFREEEEILDSNSNNIRRAEIQRNGKTYFLSWWYIQEETQFISSSRKASEWEWRKNFLMNQKPFLQINLVTNSKREAEEIYKELVIQGL